MAVVERRRELAVIVGANVRRLRKARGWSQEKLARVIEMSRETVRAMESGRSLPDVPTLELIAGAFGIELSDLLSSDSVTGRQLSDVKALASAAA